MKRGDPLRVLGAVWLVACLLAAFAVPYRWATASIVVGVIGLAVLWAIAGGLDTREPKARPGYPADRWRRSIEGDE